MKTFIHPLISSLGAACLLITALQAAPMDSAFNYNGRLLEGTTPANGDHDFEFYLFDVNRFGSPVAPAVSTPNVLVSNGLFSTVLNFGPAAFDGSGRWLEISVRRSGTGADFIILTPRQAINPVPYALFSSNAARAAIASTVAPGAVTTDSIQAGTVVTRLNGLANEITLAAGTGISIAPSGNTLILSSSGGSDTDDWKLGGNTGTSPATHFLGTVDAQPLTFKVNNTRVLRLEPNGTSPNILAGSAANSIAPGVLGAAISGGGSATEANQILAGANYGTISGGILNKVEPNALNSTVGGGRANLIRTNASNSTIAGGQNNLIESDALYGSIGGGNNNEIRHSSAYGTIPGGSGNEIHRSLNYGSIGGGNQNIIHDGANYSTLGGGLRNGIGTNAAVATIAGGENNAIGLAAHRAFIGGGWRNSISNNSIESVISGGFNNHIGDNSSDATIAGGELNVIQRNSIYATIGGGNLNSISNASLTIVAGGWRNFASGSIAVVGGGQQNTNRGAWATIPGGFFNVAEGSYAFAAGYRAQANHDGSYVWSDSSGGDFASTAPNQYLIRAAGGIGINTNHPTSALHVHGTISASTLSVDGTVSATTFSGNGSALTGIVPAAGSVGPSQLAKPYQSGTISLESFGFPWGYTEPYQWLHTVTFPTPFSAPPVVTLSLETSLSSAAERIQPISIRQRRTAGFDITFPVQNLPITVASSLLGTQGRALMAMVNGRPAVVYLDQLGRLQFARSEDSTGLRWPVATAIVPTAYSVASSFAFNMVNGYPAVAFIDDGNLRFVHASETNGATWAAPVTVQAGVSGVFTPLQISLAIINGKPAIACWDSSGSDIWYFRASDVAGNGWPATGALIGNGNSGISLAQIDGRPAISYTWEDLRFIRALDNNGDSWSAAYVTVAPGYDHGQTYLFTVGGNPAIAFQYSDNLLFNRATDTTGERWGGFVSMTGDIESDAASAYPALIGGQPAAVCYLRNYRDAGAILYIFSSNNGASFDSFFVCRNSGEMYPAGPVLLDVGGSPAITFWSREAEELRYIRDTNPNIDTYINWIAVQP